MSATSSFHEGQPCWMDIGVPDVDAAMQLYQELLGWEARPSGPFAGGYFYFHHDSRPQAGLGPATDPGPATWTVYLATERIAETARKVVLAGGEVLVEPMQVFSSGSMAICQDPTGARFALWQGMDTPGFGATDEPGAPCWFDLHTRDGAAARAFYAEVFDVEFIRIPGPGNYSTAWPKGQAPQNPATAGALFGIQDIADQPPSTPTWWQAWFQVEDVAESFAVLLGAGSQELMAPEHTPIPFTGMSHIALAMAPQGEFVGLLAP